MPSISVVVLWLTVGSVVVLGCTTSKDPEFTPDEILFQCDFMPDTIDKTKIVSCATGEYECRDRKACYTDDQKCDGNDDCADRSDEDIRQCGKMIIVTRK